MSALDANFEDYLRRIINDHSLESHLANILDTFKDVALAKNEFFVREGKVCKYFCFIESGILQHSITVLGEEKTTYLALKNSATAALKSFKNSTASRKNIKAISDCKLKTVGLEQFNNLLSNNLAFRKFYFNLIENQIYLIDDYRIDLLTLSPEDRYQKMLKNEPTLLQQVPLHYLSSFLGISSRHMTRIRKNII